MDIADDRETQLAPDVVERVLRRASELAAASDLGGSSGSNVGDPVAAERRGVSAAALLAAASEVGLSVPAVRRSIAIERLGTVRPRRRSDRFFGPAVVSVDDEIAASVPEILERLDAWLVDGHHLRRDRLRSPGRADPGPGAGAGVGDGNGDGIGAGVGEWSKRSGIVGATVRRIRGATGEGKLGDLRRVTATARDSGVGTSVVRITGDRSPDRQVLVGGGAVVAATGTAGVVAVAVIATPLVLLATPVAVVAGLGVAARGRSRARRTELEIRRLLDAVEAGGDPTRLRVDIARRVSGKRR